MKKVDQEKTKGKDLSDKQFNRIVRKYETSIHLPPKNIEQKYIICPVGLVGAGKTTVIKPISEKLGMARISTDEIRKILKNEGFNYARTTEIAQKITLDFLGKGYNIAMDGDCVMPDIQKFFKDIGGKRKLKIICVHIKPPIRFIENKLKNFKHTWLFKDAAEAIDNLNRRKPIHKKYLPDLKFYYRFDPSKDDLDIQIAGFIDKLRNEHGNG